MTTTWSGVGRPPVEVIDGGKPCSRCKIVKPLEEYYVDKSRATGRASHCKECKRNPPTDDGVSRLSAKDSVLRSKYGITLYEYNVMYCEQMGRCLLCDTYYEVLDVDHDHATGKVRGLLCNNCNRGLGMFKDNADALLAAAAYIIKNRKQD